MTAEVRAILLDGAPRCELAESPRWHEGHWWWVDVTPGKVYRAQPAAPGWQTELCVATGHRLSLVYPAGKGTVLVANFSRLEFWSTGSEVRMTGLLADVDVGRGFVLNDGVADRFGRLWIGLVATDVSRAGGRLLRVDPGGAVHVSTLPCRVSNGLAFEPTGQRMFHADSAEQVVYEHVISSAGIVRTRVFIRTDDGLPDGICCDDSGGLWVAVYGTGEVRRYGPTGELSTVVSVPTPQVTSVALGGLDGRDLLITTAREGYDVARSAAEPLAGRLFLARADVPGAAVYSVRR